MSTSYTSTGTTAGQGAANNQRGPGNKRDYFVSKVNPHVVKAGVGTASGGTLRVNVSGLTAASTNYAVIAVGSTATAPYLVKHDNVTTGFMDYFTVTCGTTDTVNWTVIAIGSGDNT